MRAKFLCLVGILLATLLSSPGFAYADFAPYGGASGLPFSKSCPANQYVAGFFGRVGGWLDDIGLTCAPAVGNTGFGPPVQTPQFFGGLGGVVTSSQCDAGSAVRHMHYFVQYDDAASDALQYIRGTKLPRFRVRIRWCEASTSADYAAASSAAKRRST